MCSPGRLVWVLMLGLLSGAGCAQVSEGDANTALVRIYITGGPGTLVALGGVEVCETDTTNCDTSDVSGWASLRLPVDVETSFTRTKKGFGSYLLALVIPASSSSLELRLTMATETRLATQHGNIMSPYPMRGEGMIATAVTPGFEGATFELPEATGKKFYMDEEFDWRLDLSGTTAGGVGGFAEVGPGEHRLEVGGTAEDCVPLWGWPGGFENSVRVPVREGSISDVLLACAVPP